jgi:hypothetical protein
MEQQVLLQSPYVDAISYTAMPATATCTFWTASSTEQMRLTSTGLGIGTSSPTGTAKIKVGNNTLAGGSYLNLQGASGSKTWFVAGNYNIGGALEFIQSTANGGSTPAGTASMLLDSSGNVGIGTTSPSVDNSKLNKQTLFAVLAVEASGIRC